MKNSESNQSSLLVLHLIGDLEKGGGAVEILYRLIINNQSNKHVVISLQDINFYGKLLEQHGVEVIGLNIKKSPFSLFKLIDVVKHIRRLSPDVIQTWMYYSDLIGGVSAKLAGVKNVVWGIHHSTMDASGSSTSSRVFAQLCAMLSFWLPEKIISCSQVGANAHVSKGYSAEKMNVIYNGYDLNEFNILNATTTQSPNSIRLKFRIPKNNYCFGMVARYDPQKDHENLFAGLAQLLDRGVGNWTCFLFGRNIENNAKLDALAAKYRLQDKVIFYGLSNNIATQVCQLDIHLLSSRFGEAFPNVLNEAMASGVPCITTDVGDSSVIVDEYGWLVPVSDPEALAAALLEAIQEIKHEPLKWSDRKQLCRSHIQRNFSIDTMVSNYEALWRK